MEPSIIVLVLRILIVSLLFAFLGYIISLLRRDMAHQEEVLLVPPAHFFLAEGPEVGQVFQLAETNLIGRAQTCTIQINEPTISAVHARLTYANTQWLLEDLGSRNGTYINDIPVEEPMPLAYGDRIRFGSVMVVLTARIDPPTQPENTLPAD
ncbi:MAG: FHA domain-containing protein [Anaerolineales bacterium]|nr:FHA domain-containing protein [Anaerolineales bacterium]